jgi:hypothetical protein
MRSGLWLRVAAFSVAAAPPGPAAAAAGLLGLAAACKRPPMASAAQCEHLLDRYIDLKLSEDAAARAMSSEDRAHRRAQIAMDVLSESDVKQVKSQCQAEVTEAEFECAVKATSSRAWNDCIQ